MGGEGKSLSMTTGSEWRHILLFSLPIMAGNILQQLYNTVDGIVVGNFVSQNALAAAGTAGTLAAVFLAFAIGFGNGSGIMIAQLFGAKQLSSLRSAISTVLILMVSLGLAFSVFGCLCARFLLWGLMNIAEGEVLELAVRYFSIYAVGLVFQFIYNAAAAILRAVGDSRATLYFLLVSSGINIALDLVFVLACGWGVAGAATATVISQLSSATVSLIYMFKKYPMFRFGKGEFVFQKDKCLLCLRLGVPATIQQSVVSFGNVFLQRLVNSFGEAVMAAYTVGVRVESYLFVTAVGFNTGVATFTAQNMGAGKLNRVRRGCQATLVLSLSTGVVLEILLYLFAPAVATFFGVEGEALTLAVSYLRFLSYFFWLFALYFVFSGVLQGSGDVYVPMCCAALSLCVRVVLAYVLILGFGLGCVCIWRVSPAGWVCAFSVAFLRYLGGRWKQKGIVQHE